MSENHVYGNLRIVGSVNRLSKLSNKLGFLKNTKETSQEGYGFFGVSYFGYNHMVMQQSNEKIKVLSNMNSNEAFAYHLLNTFSECFDKYQQDKLNEEQWNNWKIWMKLTFQHHSLMKIWTGDHTLKKYFKPDFQRFIEKEIIAITLFTN